MMYFGFYYGVVFFNVTIHSKISMNKWGIGAGRDADTGEVNFHLEGFSIV